MCYVRLFRLQAVPAKSYQVIRSCPGCGGKVLFDNTECFRVNANGRRIDVWLIYRCGSCGHTMNLTVYERKRPEEIPREDYERFLANDSALARELGTSRGFFAANKAEIDFRNIPYKILPDGEGERLPEEADMLGPGDLIQAADPCGIRPRADKLVSELLQVSRSQVKRWESEGIIEIQENGREGGIRIFIRKDLLGSPVDNQLKGKVTS